MIKKVIEVISTVFYIGYLPISGTMASFFGLSIYFLINKNNLLYAIVLAVILILGFLVGSKAEEIFNQKDSCKIVIDEVCGILIALFLLPVRLPIIIIAFFLFRALDTIKPPPFDRLQNLRGSSGVMLDDIFAAIYTNLIIQLSLRFTSAIAS